MITVKRLANMIEGRLITDSHISNYQIRQVIDILRTLLKKSGVDLYGILRYMSESAYKGEGGSKK